MWALCEGQAEDAEIMNQDRETIENISTDLGNEILDFLKSEKWKVVAQYSPLSFDKGIDYDSYVLSKNGHQLKFEWDNWFEWKIEGNKAVIKDLSNRFLLKAK